MYVLVVYVPDSHVHTLKNALFAAGAGKLGDYDCCAWQAKGMGQFRPNAHATPFVGQAHTLEYVEEWRVECVVEQHALVAVLGALKQHHPYETPAYHYYAVNV